jgi:hypothetical protein
LNGSPGPKHQLSDRNVSALFCNLVLDQRKVRSVLDDGTANTHNNRTSQFEANRDAAFSTLENHYAAVFAQEQDYASSVALLSSVQVSITNQITQLGLAEQEIARLERELSDAVKGAEQINDFMQSYFGKDDLKITVIFFGLHSSFAILEPSGNGLPLPGTPSW